MATLAEFVVDTVKRYHTAFTNKRILKTAEEVSANTNEDNLPSAVVVGELYYYLIRRIFYHVNRSQKVLFI